MADHLIRSAKSGRPASENQFSSARGVCKSNLGKSLGGATTTSIRFHWRKTCFAFAPPPLFYRAARCSESDCSQRRRMNYIRLRDQKPLCRLCEMQPGRQEWDIYGVNVSAPGLNLIAGSNYIGRLRKRVTEWNWVSRPQSEKKRCS